MNISNIVKSCNKFYRATFYSAKAFFEYNKNIVVYLGGLYE